MKFYLRIFVACMCWISLILLNLAAFYFGGLILGFLVYLLYGIYTLIILEPERGSRLVKLILWPIKIWGGN